MSPEVYFDDEIVVPKMSLAKSYKLRVLQRRPLEITERGQGGTKDRPLDRSKRGRGRLNSRQMYSKTGHRNGRLSPALSSRGGYLFSVAQICNLLYRRFVIGKAWKQFEASLTSCNLCLGLKRRFHPKIPNLPNDLFPIAEIIRLDHMLISTQLIKLSNDRWLGNATEYDYRDG